MNIREINVSKDILKNKGFFSLVQVTLTYFLKMAILPYYILKIRITQFKNEDSLVDFAFNSIFCLLKPAQVKSEILSLIKMISKEKPKNILEIGTAKRGTLFLISKVLPKDSKIMTLDIRGGPFGGGYPLWRIPLYKSFISEKQKLFLIRSNSHNKETFLKIKKLLNGEKLDFLFIDGDHTYKGVKKDFYLYNPLVRTGGLIALHDVAEHYNDLNCRVSQFWKELKKRYQYTEFIESKNQGWAGIGVIRK